jgi:hypothetical protein
MQTLSHCPRCQQPIEHSADQSGAEILCPSCQQTVSFSTSASPAVPMINQPRSPSSAATRSALPLLIETLAVLLGAGGGLWVFGRSPLIIVGALAGFLVGRTIVQIVCPVEDARRAPTWFPGAYWSLGLSIGAWVVAICFWGFVLTAGMLQGEGASLLLMFFVLPLTGVCWLIGGPIASIAAQLGLRQIQAGQRLESDRRLLRLSQTLSRLMSFALLAFLLWLVTKIS